MITTNKITDIAEAYPMLELDEKALEYMYVTVDSVVKFGPPLVVV